MCVSGPLSSLQLLILAKQAIIKNKKNNNFKKNFKKDQLKPYDATKMTAASFRLPGYI